MISDPQVAHTVSALMLEIGAKLDASVAEVQAACPESEFVNYRRAVGSVMGTMLLDIMNPLYALHADLKPSQLR